VKEKTVQKKNQKLEDDEKLTRTAVKLAEAAETGDLETLKALLAAGIDPDTVVNVPDSRTPLALACKNHHVECAGLLIAAGADVNKMDSDKRTALKSVCDSYGEKEYPPVVELLLENGADPEAYPEGSDGPLHYAAMYGLTGTVKLLVKHGALVNRKGSYGRTALMYAAMSGNSPDMITFLINNGADLRAVNDGGDTVLFELITHDNPNPESAVVLIKAGADVNAVHKNYGTPMHWAAFCGRIEIAEVLIASGADVNAPDKNGDPPITNAMSRTNIKMAKYLFEHGADPDTKTRFGTTLLAFAADNDDLEFAKSIREKSALKQKTSGSAPPPAPGALLTAARSGNLKMMKYLIESGSEPDEKDSMTSETPLMKASYHNHIKSVMYLIEKGADVKAVDSRGNTPLLHAAWSGHTAIVKYLLEHGAEVNERNRLNWNALMQACSENHLETAELLLKAGSPLNEIDREKGATALTIAESTGSTRLIELLLSYGAEKRHIVMRKPGRPWFAIAECGICEYLPHRKSLSSNEYPDRFEGLETIHVFSSEPDRYTAHNEMIKRCVNCGTYYHHDHSIDTEDAFVSGPHIDQNIRRYNLLRLMVTLQAIGRNDLLSELKADYPGLIASFISIIRDRADTIKPNLLPYYIESVMDNFIIENKLDQLQSLLLNHASPDIALDTAEALILIYGEFCRTGHLPTFTYFRDFIPELKNLLRGISEEYRSVIKNSIHRFIDHPDERIRNKCAAGIRSGEYYKVF
jgi:ankyrin repeat protein